MQPRVPSVDGAERKEDINTLLISVAPATAVRRRTGGAAGEPKSDATLEGHLLSLRRLHAAVMLGYARL